MNHSKSTFSKPTFRSVSCAVQKSCVLTTPVVRLSSFCLQSLPQEDLQRHTASQSVTILTLSYSAALRPHASAVACGAQVVLLLYCKSFFKWRSFVSPLGFLCCRWRECLPEPLLAPLRSGQPSWPPSSAGLQRVAGSHTTESAQCGWSCYRHVGQPRVAWASCRIKLLRKAQRKCHY